MLAGPGGRAQAHTLINLLTETRVLAEPVSASDELQRIRVAREACLDALLMHMILLGEIERAAGEVKNSECCQRYAGITVS